MHDVENFRQITSFERKIVLRALSTISSKILKNLDNLQYYLFISFNERKSKNLYPKIFLVKDNQKNFLNLINDKNIIKSVGQYFGFIKKDFFFLSLDGAEFLYNNKIFSEFKRLFLNKKGEKSFLYGNNISKEMVDHIPQKLNNRDFLLVFNEVNEIIGISQSQCNHQIIPTLNSKEIIAINLSDKGLYLRKAQ